MEPEGLVLNAEIYQGHDFSITEHWKKLTKGLPSFEEPTLAKPGAVLVNAVLVDCRERARRG